MKPLIKLNPPSFHTGNNQIHPEEDYWKSPCSSDSPKYIRKFPSNESVIQSSPTSTSYHYVPLYNQSDKNGKKTNKRVINVKYKYFQIPSQNTFVMIIMDQIG